MTRRNFARQRAALTTLAAPSPEIIPLHPATSGGHEVQSVGRDFSNWMKDRIRQYGFLEGTDYVWPAVTRSPELARMTCGGANAVEYRLTLNMAKELAMVGSNAQGRAIRRYFSECERIAKTVTQPVGQSASFLSLDRRRTGLPKA